MTTHSLPRVHDDVIQADHQRLHAKLERLHEQFAAASLSSAQTDRELLQTETELEEHFNYEESVGFFAEVLEFSPELDERVHQLLQQHQEMRAQFRSLRKTCRWACGESGARAGWLAEFADFHRRFNAHEQAENNLLQDALGRDVGAGD